MILEIEVTQQHIDSGHRQSCRFCPVALAIADKLQNPNVIAQVSPSYVGFYPKNALKAHNRIGTSVMPIEVSKWIMNFDLDYYFPAEPFNFSLTIYDEIWKRVKNG